MKLLVIAPQNCFPPKDGGKIGIYFPLVEYAKWGTVHYAFTTDKLPDGECTQHFSSMGIHLHPFVIVTKDSAFGLIKNLFSSIPFKFQKYFSTLFLQYLQELIRKEKITHIWINHAHMAEYALQLKKQNAVKIYLREHNIEFSLVEQLVPFLEGNIKKRLANWQYHKTKQYETTAWNLFDKVILISDADKAIAEQYYIGQNTTLIYDSYEQAFMDKLIDENIYEPESFIFTGNINTIQNAINLKTFVHEIWNPFIYANPSYKLYITGNEKVAIENLLQINLMEHHIFVMGFVEDIVSAIRSKQFFLSPTYIGAGVRIKVLNAMALGAVCFISSKDEAMLNDICNKKNSLVFNDINDFQEMIAVANNPEIYKSVSNAAKELVNQYKYSWSAYSESVKRILQ